jgi:cytochrome c oxidase cbb3-type subunit 3
MAQVSNYILTLKGTNPPDAKEKQGTLYVPEAAGATTTPADTTAAKTAQPDTTTLKK